MLLEQQTSSSEFTTSSAIVALRRRNILCENDALALTLVTVAVALFAAPLPELYGRLRKVEVGGVEEMGGGEVGSRHPAVDTGETTPVRSVWEGVGDGAV